MECVVGRGTMVSVALNACCLSADNAAVNSAAEKTAFTATCCVTACVLPLIPSVYPR